MLPLTYARPRPKRRRRARARPVSRKSNYPIAWTIIRVSSPAASNSASPSPAPSSIRPQILLADEPTGALDSATTVEIMKLFVRLNRENGITVIIVTHENEVAAYADRQITFRDGKIVEDAQSTPKPSASHRRAGMRQLWDSFKIALVALRSNKLRSVLTALGIIIGVASVIVMVAVGQGARSAVDARIASFGTNLLIVSPGSARLSGRRSGGGTSLPLTESDMAAIRTQVPGVVGISGRLAGMRTR